MTDPSLVETLREIDFLRGLSDEHLTQIAAMSQLEAFPAGHTVFREGAGASDAFLISSGSLSLEICSPGTGCRRIQTIAAGELLGWSPLLGQPRLTATARTLSPTKAVRIPADSLLVLCERDARLGYELMRRTALALSKRLSAARLQLLDIFGGETEGQ
jgi:CRP/FNR family transcriptional regulator